MLTVESINFNFTFVHLQKISSREDTEDETSMELELGEPDFYLKQLGSKVDYQWHQYYWPKNPTSMDFLET